MGPDRLPAHSEELPAALFRRGGGCLLFREPPANALVLANRFGKPATRSVRDGRPEPARSGHSTLELSGAR